MHPSDLLVPSLCLLAGVALGACFFGSLWWSVQRTARATSPILVQVASPMLRLGLAVGGFDLVGAGDAVRLLSCLAGFLIARLCATRWARPPREPARRKEASHAARP